MYGSVPRLAQTTKLLGEVDELLERYGQRRYLVPARCQRALATSLQGDLIGAATSIATIDDLFAEGFDAWFRATTHARISVFSGDYDAALASVEPDTVGVGIPHDAEFVVQIAVPRADALIWKGDLEGARRAVDEGRDAVSRHCDIFWHCWLAMVALRVEADAAVAATASRRLDLLEHAQDRAGAIAARWHAAVAELQTVQPLAEACTRAIDAEIARVNGADVAVLACAAAEMFDDISMPYYATYFRWREAAARLDAGDHAAGTDVLAHARATARSHGFAGLDAAISAVARIHQLRLGPGRTTIDGDEPLSARELEVLNLMVDGKNNPEIAEQLCISRRTARAHVSGILRKLGVTSRVEAVLDAHRRGLV